MKEYEEFFGAKGERLTSELRYFWVTISDGESVYGKAMSVAENVIPSMNGLFFGRKGHQLGLRVVGDAEKNVAAVVWVDSKSDECHPILMTNGHDIITSDPCFVPVGQDGLWIGFNDHRVEITEFSKSKLPWLSSAQSLIRKTFSGDLTLCSGIRVEEMRQRLERKLNYASVKGRRSHF